MPPETACRAMRLVAIGFFLFGLLFAALAFEPIAAPGVLLLDLIKWQFDGGAAALSQDARLLGAIGGGVLAAFAIFMYFVIAPALARNDAEIRRAAITAIIVWFVIDSAGSIAAGVASNAAYNILLLALYLAPVLGVRTADPARPKTA